MEKLSFDRLPKFRLCNFRHFEEGEKHITRVWYTHVAIFMLDGVLRFTEDGREVELCKNQYYIQKAFLNQSASVPSDSPTYFYIHFDGSIEESEDGLALFGTFDPRAMLPIFYEMEKVGKDPICKELEKRFVFYKLLTALYSSQKKAVSVQMELAEKMHDMILAESTGHLSIEEMSERLSYSKNYLIDVFKKAYGTTPYRYLNLMRLENARQMLITTDKSCQTISDECGFSEYSLFYKLFCARYGISPKKCRTSLE